MDGPRRKEIKHGEDYLKDIGTVTLVLENGQRVTLSPDEEFRIPTEPIAMERERRRAPARFSFWSYQSERALERVKVKKKEIEESEGLLYLTYRKWYVEESTEVTITEGMIRARLAVDESLKGLKSELISLERQYGLLRVMRDGMRERIFVLRDKTAQLSEERLEA